ncbi:hypothetical protein F2Q69_00059589 [Brassica cretica]|uniref:Uncharacterized protein n=1 Tax=Brassica cretica TaxID=69181 RepID=A0A8S9RFA0_BRACR|nr:hypothetical protein F2Q69_00059589 [Brassica cretica]
MNMSTKSNEGIWFLLVEPLDLECVIHKSKTAVDTLQAAIGSVEIQVLNDTVHQVSNDTAHPDTVNPKTVHPDTVHPDTVHPDTVHPLTNQTIHQVSIFITYEKIEKVEVLILSLDETGILRDEEGRTRNSA